MTLQLTRSGTAKSSMWTCANLAPVCRVVYGVSIDTRPASRAWYLPGGFFSVSQAWECQEGRAL